MKELTFWQTSIESLIEHERLDDADQQLALAFHDFPDAPVLKYLEARIAYEVDSHNLALSLINEALVHDPKNASYRRLHFHVLLAIKRFFEAEKIIISLIAEFPEEATYYALYSLMMMQTRHVEKALKLAHEALRLDPGSYLANLVTALHERTLGQSKQAEITLRKLLTDHPECEATARLLIHQLVDKGEYLAALRLSQDVLQKNPQDISLIELIIELKILTHPLCRSFYVLNRFGLAGSAMAWLGFIFISRGLVGLGLTGIAFIFALSYLAWAVSSWILPPFLRRRYRKGLSKC